MTTMAAQTVAEWPAGGEAFTKADLEGMPDDGHRYELIDGSLIVTPAPNEGHQTVVTNLIVMLMQACPANVKVLVAPFDVDLAVDTRVQPDVLVVPRAEKNRSRFEGPPTLVVEILSPSTRHLDRGLKRARYQTAGCPSYWIVDPDAPSVLALELRDGTYVEVGHASGTDALALQQPFPVMIVPANLTR